MKAKKSLGQHFLTDRNIISKIIHSISEKEKVQIIEIGPGTGAITDHLIDRFDEYLAIELDSRAIEILKEKHPGINIAAQDVLKVDWDHLINPDLETVIVGNLPYYITSPILFSLLEIRDHLVSAYLMMQKEVADRLVAEPNSKDYGILSVQTQLMSSPELLFNVSPNSFSPPPKVMSTVLKLIFDKPALVCKDSSLKTVVRTAFNQRRKKLSNSLKPVLQDAELPVKFNWDERAENWNPETYEKLAVYLEQNDIL